MSPPAPLFWLSPAGGWRGPVGIGTKLLAFTVYGEIRVSASGSFLEAGTFLSSQLFLDDFTSLIRYDVGITDLRERKEVNGMFVMFEKEEFKVPVRVWLEGPGCWRRVVWNRRAIWQSFLFYISGFA